MFALFLSALLASASPVDEALERYEKIRAALAGDSVKGVVQEAQAIEGQLGQASKDAADPTAKELLESARSAARQVGEATDLGGMRQHFGSLSQALVEYVQKFHPNKKPYLTAYCPMTKKSWIQRDRTISNPYYGSSMLHCGTIQ